MRRLLIAAAVPLALLVPSACGDDSSGGSSGSSSQSAGEDGGSDDSSADVDLCTALTADQIGEAIGATVTIEPGPTGDCEFEQEDPRALSGSIGVLPFSDVNGGYDSYASGAEATLTDAKVNEVSGVGDKAFVVTGTFGTGESIQGSGGAQVGTDVATVNVVQSQGLSEAEVLEAGTALLELVAGVL